MSDRRTTGTAEAARKDSGAQRTPVLDRVFELRTIIAILFGVYGVFCTIWGIGFTTAEEIRRAAGFNVNLIMGIAMLLAAVAFSLWVIARPVEQDERRIEEERAEVDR